MFARSGYVYYVRRFSHILLYGIVSVEHERRYCVRDCGVNLYSSQTVFNVCIYLFRNYIRAYRNGIHMQRNCAYKTLA